MREEFSRTELLLGEQGMYVLEKARVVVFGLGGVGGHAAEALVRSGIGQVTVVDDDIVCRSNLNRQLIATQKTIGRKKTEVMRERLLDINPDCRVICRDCFYLPETAGLFEFTEYDYVLDAVDTITAKLEIAVRAMEAGTPLISSMGAGNKLDPSRFEVADIYQTSVCPLAKVMRRELKKRGVPSLKVVYSKEEARKPEREGSIPEEAPGNHSRREIPGSTSFVPSVAGLIMAAEAIRDLTGLI